MSFVMLTPEEAEEGRKKAEAEFQEAFLAEVERRAGASRTEMLKVVDKANLTTYIALSEQWLRRILGEKP